MWYKVQSRRQWLIGPLPPAPRNYSTRNPANGVLLFVGMDSNQYNICMSKRLLISLLLAFMPAVALADDTAPAPAPDSASSAGLGPQSSSGGAGAGGSNADAGSLQPAGNSPLQSTTNDSSGLTAPSNALQGAAPSTDQLQVLSTEGDGPHQQTGSPANNWTWLGLTLAIAVVIGLGAIVMRDRRRFAENRIAPRPAVRTIQEPEADSTPEPAPGPEPEIQATTPKQKSRKHKRRRH